MASSCSRLQTSGPRDTGLAFPTADRAYSYRDADRFSPLQLVANPAATGVFDPTLEARGRELRNIDAQRFIERLGDGANSMQRVFVAVSAGGTHSCGVTMERDAYCWGVNAGGRLGDGTTMNRLAPVAVTGGLDLLWVSAGGVHTCGVTTGGEARCWGANHSGQLGDGTTTDRLTPVMVAGRLEFASVDIGSGTSSGSSCGVTTSGEAYCWGLNSSGQLGDGTTTSRLTPVAVAGGLEFGSVSAGNRHTCGVTTGGEAYCWGVNPTGQLGDGTTTSRLTPVPVAAGLIFASVSTAIESCTGLGVNPRGWTVGVGWIDRLRVSGCIHTLEFLRRPVAEGGVQASSIVYLLKEVGESVG